MTSRAARLRVAMYTTVRPRCGISDYTAALTAALSTGADVSTVRIEAGTLNPLRLVRDAARLGGHDVCHVQHTYSFFGVDHLTYTLAIRLLRRRIRGPLLLTAHTVRPLGPTRYDGRLGSALANLVSAPAWHDVETFRAPEGVIVHARLHRERLVSRGVPAVRCHVIPPGVPAAVEVSESAVGAFRTRHAVAPGPVVGVFGFVDRSKRIVALVDALRRGGGASARVPTLLLAGGARLPEHEAVVAEVRQAAAAAGLADRVVVTGYLPPDEVPVALAAMDVVAVPYATDDSMSYSLHVALGQGRPVVATDVAPIAEVYERGQCLALVKRDSADAFADTLESLLDSPDARRHLSAAAREYAAAESMATAAARTLEAYRDIVETRRG